MTTAKKYRACKFHHCCGVMKTLRCYKSTTHSLNCNYYFSLIRSGALLMPHHAHTPEKHMLKSSHPLDAEQSERSAAVSHTPRSRQCITGPSSIHISWQPSGEYLLLNNALPHFLLLNSQRLLEHTCVCHAYCRCQ